MPCWRGRPFPASNGWSAPNSSARVLPTTSRTSPLPKPRSSCHSAKSAPSISHSLFIPRDLRAVTRRNLNRDLVGERNPHVRNQLGPFVPIRGDERRKVGRRPPSHVASDGEEPLPEGLLLQAG